MTYRTLGELRSELLSRMGMGGQGSAGAADAIMNSFLRNGQAQLYWAQDWRHLTDWQDKTIGVDQNIIDYPNAGTMTATNTAQRDRRLLRIESVINGQWRELIEGISTRDWSFMDTKSWPAKYERMGQVLIYPKADAVYTLRFWFVADLGRFTQDDDRASLDDEMILLHAITNAKAHYRHPDSALYQGQLSTLMSTLRGQSFSGNGVVRREPDTVYERKPAVVGRDA